MMMMIHKVIPLLVSFLAGLAMGALFFGGLWITVKKSMTSKYTAMLFLLSFLVRMALVISGFYYLAQFGWPIMFVALTGFLAARILTTHFIKRLETKEHS